jgi:hypothetical protein
MAKESLELPSRHKVSMKKEKKGRKIRREGTERSIYTFLSSLNYAKFI